MKTKLFITILFIIANCFSLKANEPIMLNGKIYTAFLGTLSSRDAPRMFCELIFDNDSVIVRHYTLYYSTNDKRHHCSENKYHWKITKYTEIYEEEEIFDGVVIPTTYRFFNQDAIMIEGFDKYGLLTPGRHHGIKLYPTDKDSRDRDIEFELQKEKKSSE